jgi:glycosyltransferase involved in cell wall biosynthesis
MVPGMRKALKVDIWHNILWSKYKGGVFSALFSLSEKTGIAVRFFQIAETEKDRLVLSSVDLNYHHYPFELMFPGAYEQIPLWRRVVRLYGEVLRTEADIVVLPGYHRIEYWAMLLACIQQRRSRAVFCDSTKYDRPKHWIRGLAKRFFFKRCHGYFAYGQRSREYLIENRANPDHIFFRCQAAALPQEFGFAAARSGRVEKAASLEAPRFLYVGRLAREKGLEVLLEAFRKVQADVPRAQLALVGSGPWEGPLRQWCKAHQLEKDVLFLGSMGPEALGDQYQKASCLVLPSFSEPWGLVVNEALSYGCPVVVSHVCGCVPELVVEGETGYAFPAGDPDALARRMEDVLAMGEVGAVADQCQRLIEQFSPERAADQILRGCLEIANNREVSR